MAGWAEELPLKELVLFILFIYNNHKLSHSNEKNLLKKKLFPEIPY